MKNTKSSLNKEMGRDYCLKILLFHYKHKDNLYANKNQESFLDD
jgi:hypothetical protein